MLLSNLLPDSHTKRTMTITVMCKITITQNDLRIEIFMEVNISTEVF
jgi:hypothetical protein